jgi:L-alanine-DL-glutamate epimerase-like enolase superfamily enzyme
MKIKKVEIIPVDIPYQAEFRISSSPWPPVDRRPPTGNFVILKLLTDEGVEGIGSSASLRNRESAMLIMRDLASRILLGQDPLNTERILNQIDAGQMYWDSVEYPIKAHVDYALYDLKGKILNVPVYQLLGGLCREKVPLEWILVMDDPEVMAEKAVKYVKAGFRGLKIHVGGDPEMAVKRFRTVREAVGPEIPIGIDISSVAGSASWYNAWDVLRLIKELEKYDLNYAEQVVTTYDVDGFLAIKSRTAVPLVADASGRSVLELHSMIKRGAADIFHCLLSRVGGLRLSSKYATLIEAANLDYAICSTGNGIEHAAGAHFVVSRTKRERILDELALILYLHGGTETEGIKTDVTKQINGKIEKGYLYPPRGPGLGIELNQDVIDQCHSPHINTIVVQ